MPLAYEFRGGFYRDENALRQWHQRGAETALEPELPIIDSHHHHWDDGRGHYLIRDFAQDLASGHNIVATVAVEAHCMVRASGPPAMKPVGEVEFLNGMAAMGASGRFGATRFCAGIVGHADLTLGDGARPVLEALIAAGNGRLRGIRHSVTWDSGNATAFGSRRAPRHVLLDPQFRKGFAHLQTLGLPFDAWQFHPQLPELADLLHGFPDTEVVLDHVGGLLGIPPHDHDRGAVFETWRASIRELARFPNLTVKLGGLGMMYCGWEFHLPDVPPTSEDLAAAWRPYIETCIEAFGPGRCMMESNFPVDKQTCSYGVLWNTMKRITAACSADEKRQIYHDTAARVYRLVP